LKEKDTDGVVIGSIVLVPGSTGATFTGTDLTVAKGLEVIKGKIYVTVLDHDDNFVGQTEIEVELPIAEGKVVNTTKGIAYDAIQDAIAEAIEGDTILVTPGTYTENVNINKAITLKSLNGRESTEIAGTITITADDVTVEGFTVTAQGYYKVPVIHMIGIDNVNILNNTVVADDDAYGAIGTSTGPAKITGKISGNTVTGMIMVGTDGAVEVSNNNVTLTTASTEGICFYPVGLTAEITVTGNTVGAVTEGNVQIKVNEKPLSVNGENSELDMLAAITADNNEATAKLAWLDWLEVDQGVLLTAPKTYGIISKAGLMNLDNVLADADLGEGKAATVNLAADIDLTGETWTPISRMWFTFNGNGHTISNLTTESTRKAGLFGYAGAVTVNDLTLENVTVTGSQAGVFAGSGEGFTANNCVLKGTNTVNFTPTDETWNGIGAITGILLDGTVNVTIDAGTTVTLNRGDMTTAVECIHVDDLTGHVTNNKGTVTNNGTVDALGTIAYVIATEAQLRDALASVEEKRIILGVDMDLTAQLRIGGPVELDGNGKTINVQTAAENQAILLTSDDIEMKDVTITGPTMSWGIVLVAGIKGVVIDDVTVTGMGGGIYANPDSQGEIKNCTFDTLGTGIGYDRSDFEITGNSFEDITSMYLEIFGNHTEEEIAEILLNNAFDDPVKVVIEENGLKRYTIIAQ
jgi:hypothetical protein